MNRTTLPAVLFAVLMVTSLGAMGVGASPEPTSTGTISDSAEDGWDKTTPEEGIADGADGFELDRSSDSYDTEEILDQTSESDRLDVSSTFGTIEDNWVSGTNEKHTRNRNVGDNIDYTGTMERTAVTEFDGTVMFLVTRCGTSGCAPYTDYIYDEDGDRVASLQGDANFDFSGRDSGGLADASDTNFVTNDGDPAHLIHGDVYGSSAPDFAYINTDTGSEGIIDDPDINPKTLGMANSPNGNNKFYIMDATDGEYEGTTNILEVELLDGGYLEIHENYDLGSMPNHRGLGFKEDSYTFVTYDEDNQEVVEFRTDGTVISTYEPFSDDDVGAAGAVEDRDDDRYIHVSPTRFDGYRAYDFTSSSEAQWTSDTLDLEQWGGDVSGSVDIAASVYDDYDFEVQTRDADGQWESHDSATIAAEQGTETIHFDTEFEETLELRVNFQPDGNVRLGEIPPDPRVSSIDLDHEYHASDGSLRAHDAYDEGSGIDISNVGELDEITFDGENNDDSQVDVDLVNREEEVLCEFEDVVDSRVDLEDCDIDTSQYENQEVFLDFQYDSTGGESDTLEAWELTYDEHQYDIDITDWEVIGGYESDDPREIDETQFRSAIQSTDLFTVTDVEGDNLDGEIDDVRWYVNNDEVEHYEDVPADEPFGFNQTWDESGTHTVTAEVFNEDHGTATQSWEVSVYDILIGGQDSYSGSQGDVINVVQQFQVFETDDAEIEYELEYDEDVVIPIHHEDTNGTINGTVDSGMTQEWEFQIQKAGYSGEPIEITATYDDVGTEKTIQVSSRSGGGWPGVGDDIADNVLSNTWLESLIGGIVDVEESTYIYVQTILTGGLLGALWLHHRRVIGFPVGNEALDSISARHKVAFSSVVGALGVGLILPWVIVVTVLTGFVWFFWGRIQGVIDSI